LAKVDPPELRIGRLLIAYREIGRTLDELPLPFRGIEAECGKPDTGVSVRATASVGNTQAVSA
jgi:hypothetical protein